MSTGWKVANINDIGPVKDSWSAGWHSIRHFFGIEGFGINAASKNAGDSITPEHDEAGDGQQEVFIVLEGEAEFTLDGKTQKANKFDVVFIEPQVRRSAKALATPTTVLVVGGTPGKAYKVGNWEKV
jgi:uncharacterized cupin superfamily protein